MRRTGTGDVPVPPTMGVAALGLLLQPTTFNTVILIFPALGGPPPSTKFINACKNPTIVTLLVIAAELSMIGMVTIELLVETSRQ